MKPTATKGLIIAMLFATIAGVHLGRGIDRADPVEFALAFATYVMLGALIGIGEEMIRRRKP